MSIRIVALIGAASLALLSCASVPDPGPAPEPGVEHVVERRDDRRCRRGACTSMVQVGEQRYALEMRARMISPEAASGRPARPRTRGVLSGIGGWLARGVLQKVGFQTTHHEVGSGSLVARDSVGGSTMTCDLVWLREETRQNVDGRDSSTYRRLAEGASCEIATGRDGAAVRWRLRWGISPAPDSMAVLLDSLTGLSDEVTPGAPSLIRFSPDDESGVRYRFDDGGEREGRDSWSVMDHRYRRWTVQRPDATPVGAVEGARVRPDPGVDSAELALLRLIGVLLSQPLETT